MILIVVIEFEDVSYKVFKNRVFFWWRVRDIEEFCVWVIWFNLARYFGDWEIFFLEDKVVEGVFFFWSLEVFGSV